MKAGTYEGESDFFFTLMGWELSEVGESLELLVGEKCDIPGTLGGPICEWEAKLNEWLAQFPSVKLWRVFSYDTHGFMGTDHGRLMIGMGVTVQPLELSEFIDHVSNLKSFVSKMNSEGISLPSPKVLAFDDCDENEMCCEAEVMWEMI